MRSITTDLFTNILFIILPTNNRGRDIVDIHINTKFHTDISEKTYQDLFRDA